MSVTQMLTIAATDSERMATHQAADAAAATGLLGGGLGLHLCRADLALRRRLCL